MSKKSTVGLITAITLLLALATPCVWLAGVNRQKRLDTAVFAAAEQGTEEDLKRAIEAGGRVDVTMDDLKPILIPCPKLPENSSIRKFLLALNISPDPEEYGDSRQPIHLATSAGRPKAVAYLLHSGASATAPCWGIQPIHFATVVLDVESVKLLLAAGAKIDARTETEGNQPLHCAVNPSAQTDIQKLKAMVAFLLASGASLSAKNNAGLTPADVIKAGLVDCTPLVGETYTDLQAFLETAAKESSLATKN